MREGLRKASVGRSPGSIDSAQKGVLSTAQIFPRVALEVPLLLYAGFEGESKLLRDEYLLTVGKDEHEDGQGERVHETLPLYLNAEARTFAYWDHEPRMPWQTPKYYAAQRKQLRPIAYVRLHENRWTTAESIFITSEMYDAIVDSALRPLLPVKGPQLYVGTDIGVKSDTSAVVAVYREADRIKLAQFRIWTPSGGGDVNIESVEQYLETLHRNYTVAMIYCDPSQFYNSIQRLKAKTLKIEEYPQTTANTLLMGSTLYDLFKTQSLSLYKAPDLREHVLNGGGRDPTGDAAGEREGVEEDRRSGGAVHGMRGGDRCGEGRVPTKSPA